MADHPIEEIRCEGCGKKITVPPDWRLVECPACGHPNARMDEDPSYD